MGFTLRANQTMRARRMETIAKNQTPFDLM
jgi:hypothetical protein